MKTLVIVNGVTGAIGSACLARFSRDQNVTIIGLSRQARDVDAFCIDNALPDKTIICSVGDITQKTNFDDFVTKIDRSAYEKIVYIHSVGIFPFECDANEDVSIDHDLDGDGINDHVMQLSHNAFFAMTCSLEKLQLPIHAVIIGSIADKFKSIVHTSWWKVMGKIKERMQKEVLKQTSTKYSVLNISSVICPNELIARPFVFQHTNADARFWLMPHEIAEKIHAIITEKQNGFVEDEIFHPADYYEEDHFAEGNYVKRRKAELGI